VELDQETATALASRDNVVLVDYDPDRQQWIVLKEYETFDDFFTLTAWLSDDTFKIFYGKAYLLMPCDESYIPMVMKIIPGPDDEEEKEVVDIDDE
jgi:hypothetical protein